MQAVPKSGDSELDALLAELNSTLATSGLSQEELRKMTAEATQELAAEQAAGAAGAGSAAAAGEDAGDAKPKPSAGRRRR